MRHKQGCQSVVLWWARRPRDYTMAKQSQAEGTGSFKANKGWFVNFKKWTSPHNMIRIRDSAFADHVASTTYAEHLKKITEDYILHQILKLEVPSLKFKHKTRAVMAPCMKGWDHVSWRPSKQRSALCSFLPCILLSFCHCKNFQPQTPTPFQFMTTQYFLFSFCTTFHVSLIPLTPFFLWGFNFKHCSLTIHRFLQEHNRTNGKNFLYP